MSAPLRYTVKIGYPAVVSKHPRLQVCTKRILMDKQRRSLSAVRFLQLLCLLAVIGQVHDLRAATFTVNSPFDVNDLSSAPEHIN